MGKIVLTFLIYCATELFVTVGMVDRYSFFDVFLYFLSTGFLGMALLSILGRNGLQEFQTSLQMGQMPQAKIISRGMMMFGAVLIMLPGFLNDVLGVLFILPVTRHLLKFFFEFVLLKYVGVRMVRFAQNGTGFSAGFGAGVPPNFGKGFGDVNTSTEQDVDASAETIEAQYRKIDDDQKKLN